MVETLDETRSAETAASADASSARPLPHLFVLMESTRLAAATSRHCLGGTAEVRFARGGARQAERSGAAGQQILELRLPDAWMSSGHALLQRRRTSWVLRDCGSKNGICVNGQQQQEAILLDGDIFVLGRTFFLFRERLVPGRQGADVELSPGAPSGPLVTLLPELAHHFAEVERLAASRTPILIYGPTGAGKEVLAQAMHRLSQRTGPLIAINCGAMPATLIESELFGAEKGAFSGAAQGRNGLVVASSGGTLFLDEIGDLPLAAQAAFLRVLEEQRVRKLGATSAQPVDLRVVAATNRDLELQVQRGEFRDDLVARLSGALVQLPPLRERREDLGYLIATLLRRIAGTTFETLSLSSSAAWALLRYSWPRNIRELHRCLERAVSLIDGHEIDVEHLPEAVRNGGRIIDQEKLGRQPESEDERKRRDEIVALLREHSGNVSAVARSMGKVRPQVQRWIKRYGIVAEHFRHGGS